MVTARVPVVDREPVGPDMVALTLETPVGFSARPGQFVLVRATIDGDRVGRHYTLSSPAVTDTFEITVEADATGTLSHWLADRCPGDVIHLKGPFGRVHYDDEGALLLIAGGVGIGGAVGIAERALGDGGSVGLVYEDDGFAHQRRLAALSRAGAVGILVRTNLAAAVSHLVDHGKPFVIGYREFVDRALAAIEAAGRDPEGAKVENFGPR